jgi:hypothetical protein
VKLLSCLFGQSVSAIEKFGPVLYAQDNGSPSLYYINPFSATFCNHFFLLAYFYIVESPRLRNYEGHFFHLSSRTSNKYRPDKQVF